MADKLFLAIEKYKNDFFNKRILVAVSGGVDSLSLLLSFNEWNKYDIYFEAITIDHKLRPSSSEEAEYVHEMCEKLGVKHTIKTWEDTKPAANIESIAREKRYSLIKEYYDKNHFDFLLVAHHLDDQAETFFIRLFRGSGIDGLASMDDISELYGMKIVRPFLSLHKEDLQDYLEKKNVKWLEDESNNDEKYLRNKVRVFLNSFPNKNEITRRIDFAVKEIGKAKNFINEEFKKYKKLLDFKSFGTCTFSCEKIRKINYDIGLKLLAHISMRISGNVYKPRLEKLKNLYDNITNLAKGDKFRSTFYGCIFEKCGEDLIIVYREYSALGADVKLIFNEKVIWDNRFTAKLLVDKDDLYLGHVKDGDFTALLRQTRVVAPEKYKELKNIVGVEKNVFYTLPVVKTKGDYILDYKEVSIEFL
ncbi:MAG: tRNA lysidine(34) synthetase TilS [Rickettsiales bacterium]|jgi:tRNA(Ile)-lysidine synthase|nr:tRNA lysidine(34) synthetase TilS [Rickettsiales bacterium]